MGSVYSQAQKQAGFRDFLHNCSQAMNTGRAALSLGCCGARVYLDILTEEMALRAMNITKEGDRRWVVAVELLKPGSK